MLAGVLLIKMLSKWLNSDGAVSAHVWASFSCLLVSKINYEVGIIVVLF